MGGVDIQETVTRLWKIYGKRRVLEEFKKGFEGFFTYFLFFSDFGI